MDVSRHHMKVPEKSNFADANSYLKNGTQFYGFFFLIGDFSFFMGKGVK